MDKASVLGEDIRYLKQTNKTVEHVVIVQKNSTWNKFSAELPLEISEASSLVLIQLSSNKIFGHMPEGIGKFKKLTSLTLYKNNLSGVLPDSIGSCVSYKPCWKLYFWCNFNWYGFFAYP